MWYQGLYKVSVLVEGKENSTTAESYLELLNVKGDPLGLISPP